MDELWNFGGEDFQEAMMGIVFPPRKESKEGAEEKEDLVESLRQLIMGKFDDSKDDFYKWSQTIHDEVRYTDQRNHWSAGCSCPWIPGCMRQRRNCL